MKKFGQGLFVGVLITLLLVSTIALAVDNPIKLIINGREIVPDVTPQLINGRVLVPARFVAEALGAKVDWDQENRAVVITSVKDVAKHPETVDGEWVSLIDITAIADVVVTDKIYIQKDGTKIILDPKDYAFTVTENGSVVDSGQAKLENDTTYLPLSILQKYSLR